MATRCIEDLRGSHKGEIWVLGCGPSLDDFPDDFFDDKVSIALNWSFLAFPNCTYFTCWHIDVSDFIRKYMSRWTDKWILWFPPQDKLNHEWVDKQRDIILMERCVRGMTREDFDGAVDAIMSGKPYKYVDKGTILHTGIQAAAILGASKITLAGCEGFASPGQDHAQRRGIWAFYHDVGEKSSFKESDMLPPQSLVEFGADWVAKAIREYGPMYGSEVMHYYFEAGAKEPPKGIAAHLGTIWLLRAFERHGVKIMRYFYKDGYYFKKGYEKVHSNDRTVLGGPKRFP